MLFRTRGVPFYLRSEILDRIELLPFRVLALLLALFIILWTLAIQKQKQISVASCSDCLDLSFDPGHLVISVHILLFLP
jgi:hypothetical protein